MTSPVSAASFARTVEIETPELVSVTYSVAGVGSRAAAALIDYALCAVFLILLFIAFAVFSVRLGLMTGLIGGSWAIAVLTLGLFAILWLYYVLFEAFMDGQTPGKRLMKLRVVRDGGLSVDFPASAVRNLVRIVDMQPGLMYLVGIVSLVVTRTGKRLGDIAAGTIVVREDVIVQPQAMVARRDGADTPLRLHASLTDAQYDVLDKFVQRRFELDESRRDALAAQLAGRFQHALQDHPGDTDISRLTHLRNAEQHARAQGISARNETGAARERHAIIAASATRWSGFALKLTRAQRGGLKSLGEDGVRDFVQEYRDVTADLARLRTATRGRQASEVFYLNRLVSTAHNLLYRRRALSPQRVLGYLFAEVPREVRASVRPIALAALVMFLPMIVTAVAVVRNPQLAETMLPPAMLDRAERGVIASKVGKGYIDDPQILRPVFASRLITNNVQVAFFAFASGITAGVFTLWILLSNGVSIGSVFGLYMSKGIGALLLAFVASHGVLELSAITIAGGAGLLLAAGMLLPGDRTRARALAENGRRSIKLVAASTLFLLVAGTLEGFVSPNSSLTAANKFAISAATALLLVLFLSLGRQNAATVHPEP